MPLYMTLFKWKSIKLGAQCTHDNRKLYEITMKCYILWMRREILTVGAYIIYRQAMTLESF